MDDPPIDDGVDQVEDLAKALGLDLRERRWVKAAVLALDADEPDELDPRVKYAYDKMRIAACERIMRALQSDLPASSSL